MTSTNIQPATMAAIEARLKERSENGLDVSKHPVVFHESIGVSFRVTPMNYVDFSLWHSMKDMAAKDKRNLEFQKRADKFLLVRAVETEGGEALSDKFAENLFAVPGSGVDTSKLLEAAAAQNPPRDALAPETILAYGFSRATIVLIRVLQEAGLFDLLRARLSENKAGCAALTIWEETIPFWASALDEEKAAREIGIERDGEGEDDAG